MKQFCDSQEPITQLSLSALNEDAAKTAISCSEISTRHFTSEIDLLPIQTAISSFPFVKETDA
jgi:hypothetical protein